MKYFIFFIGGIIITLLIVHTLKAKKDLTGSAGSNTPEINIKAIIKTPEFKVLSKTKEFQNLLLSKTVLNAGKDYIFDWIAEQYGI